MDEDEPLPKRPRFSLGEALEIKKERHSALQVAEIVLEDFQQEFQISDEDLERKRPAILKRLKNRIDNSYSKQKKEKKTLAKEELEKPALTKSMVDVLESESSDEAVPDTKKVGRPPADFDDVCDRAQRLKLEPIIEQLKKFGEELGGKSVTELCGKIIQQQNWVHNRPLGLIGRAIYQGDVTDNYGLKSEMEPGEALFMKNVELEISDSQYVNQRLRSLKYNMVMPSLNKLKEYERMQRYPLLRCLELDGFRATLPDIVNKRLSQILLIPEVQKIVASLDPSSFPLKLRIMTGFDGSGSQQTAMQKSRNHVSQQNRETVVAILRDLKTQGGLTVYENTLTASSRGANPYMLFARKENRDLLAQFLKFMDEDKEKIEAKEMKVSFQGKEIDIISFVQLLIADGKAVKEGSGCGGAYCLLGLCSKEDAHDIDKIESGFQLDRTIAQVEEICEMLFDLEKGTMSKSKNDYPVRKGVTNPNLTTQPINLAPHPLHDNLRMYTWFQKLLYLKHAGIEGWRVTAELSALFQESKEILIESMRQKTGIVMSKPTPQGGTTDTGNNASRFFSPESLPFLKENFESDCIEDILKLHKNFSIILRVGSSKRPVDIERLQQICIETNVMIVTKFPSAELSETVHMVLGHIWQLIALNDGYGLGQMTEQGLEGMNKLIRRFSERFARHVSLEANMLDVMHRLQTLSNPLLMTYQREKFCNRCKTRNDHWTVSCPKKDQVQGCMTLRQQLFFDWNEEVESYLF